MMVLLLATRRIRCNLSLLSLKPFRVTRSAFSTQAVLTTLISMACVSILYTVQPFREKTDNTVVVLGQALVYSWIFVLLLRIVRVGEGGPTVAGCVALVAATIGLFAFALHAIYSQLRKMNTGTDDPPAVEEDSGDETVPGETKHGGNSPQEMEEIGVTIVSTDDDERLSTTAPSTKSAWELFGLCAAEPEATQDAPAGSQGSDEVATLLAKIEAQKKKHT